MAPEVDLRRSAPRRPGRSLFAGVRGLLGAHGAAASSRRARRRKCSCTTRRRRPLRPPRCRSFRFRSDLEAVLMQCLEKDPETAAGVGARARIASSPASVASRGPRNGRAHGGRRTRRTSSQHRRRTDDADFYFRQRETVWFTAPRYGWSTRSARSTPTSVQPEPPRRKKNAAGRAHSGCCG